MSKSASKNVAPIIFFFKVNDGWLLLPASLAQYLYRTQKTLENIQSWGEFRKIVKPEIYQLCFLLSYEYRHGSVTYVAIPKERENDPTYDHFTDDNLNFDLDLGRYIGALQKFKALVHTERDWLPADAKVIFGSSIRAINLAKGLYFFEEQPRFQEFCSLLNKSDIPYVFVSKSNYINIFSLMPDNLEPRGEEWEKEYERRNKWIYKPNCFTNDWDIDASMAIEYNLGARIVKQYNMDANLFHERKEYYLPEVHDPDIFFADIKLAGYVVLDWGFSFDLHSILRAEDEIYWEDRASRMNTGYKVEYRDIPLVYHTRYYNEYSKDDFFSLLLKGQIDNLSPNITPELHQSLRRFWSIEDLAINFITDFHTHGPFAIEFFYLKGRSTIAREIIREPPSQDILQKTLAANSGPNQSIGYQVSETTYNITGASNIIYEYILRLLISYLREDEKNISFLRDWIDQASSVRECAYCGKTFKLVNIPPWLYCGSGGVRDCCFLCSIMEFPQKEKIKPRIRNFINACGFIPFSDAGLSNYSFMSRVDPNKKRDVIISFAKMGRPKHVIKLFGSWFEGLFEAEALPDGIMVTKRGIRCMAVDKHVCLSLAEQQIDDWLTLHGIEHEREPYYPENTTLNASGSRRADWLVGDTYIEYFGLKGEEAYDKKMGEKIKLAQELNLRLISLFSSDLVNLDQILTPLLARK
jgi:hypothetical protein